MVTTLLLQLTLAFPPDGVLSPLTRAIAVDEAARLWSPHGISIAAAVGEPRGRPGVVTVAIVEQAGAPESAASRPLGAIAFDEDGKPATVIAVYLADILRLVSGVRVLGAAESQWPPLMRQRIVGRVIGRVLAHEIGHYTLRTPDHARAGLMRRAHVPLALVAPERRPFALSKAEAARLADRPGLDGAR
jgi:hypothetical protein